VNRAGAALLTCLLLVVGGCSVRRVPEPRPSPVALPWREAAVPVPPGGAGRVMLRDVVACPGGWFAVGAVGDAAGGTRPAAWSSADGAAWSPVPVVAQSYYGRRNVLSSVACRDGRMAALGARSGGAHGNPRTSSWHQGADGVLREVLAPFVLFGGSTAVNVARMDAGPRGFLISGNRMTGAAVWTSVDAARFEILEGAPGLASDVGGETWAFDAVGSADGWLLVGGFLPAGRTDRDVLGWRSADGSVWRRLPTAGASGAFEELQRVVLRGAVPVGVGLRGSSFGVWRLESGQWRPAGAFGSVRPGGSPGVRALSESGGRLFCVTTDGSSYGVWVSDDAGSGWRPVAAPVEVPAVAESALVVGGGGGRVVALSDDGVVGRIHVAEIGT
jgi:hypothetical protein